MNKSENLNIFMKNKTLHIFPFIKYIRPAWYFNMKVESDYPVWVNYDLLDNSSQMLISLDENYSSRSVSLRDAAYVALQKGVICSSKDYALVLTESPSVQDNYRFLRKFFNKSWATIVLIIRLFSLCNPFEEFKAFFATRHIRKVDVFSRPVIYDNFMENSGGILEESPKVSVIIPTLNRYKYLKDVLTDLSQQTYQNFDVLICDQSEPVDRDFYQKNDSIDLKLIIQEEKALWKARNRCIKESDSDYLLLFDDDSRVEPDWIESHLRCVHYFKAEISSGVSMSTVGAKVPGNYSFFRRGDQLDTGNVLIHRDVFRKVGLFDRQFEKQRMGDGEFGLRCFLSGIVNISNPLAQRIHLKVSSGGLRQMGSWDAFRPKNILSPRPIPSVLYLVRKYFGNARARLFLSLTMPFSVLPYHLKGKTGSGVFSLVVFLLLFPVFLIQIIKSWNIASGMLRKGALIEHL
ncbi:GT2 family glycosyltransferase [Marinilabilia salmonicolor]|nr:GT2 family glycosyltransferase [Marinilabilia salmonicolor]